MLMLQMILLCALTRCNAGEYVDGAWIVSSGDDQGKATVRLPGFPSSALSFMNVYRNPKPLLSRQDHLQSMLCYRPMWYNSKRAEEYAKREGLISGRQAETSRRRIFDEENDSLMKPSVRAPSDENEDSDIPRALYTLPTKRNAESNETESQPPACNRLEEYLCKGMNHPLCIVRYPSPESTEGDSKCRVVVRCEYTSTFVSKQGLCFAIRMAFPAPKLFGVDHLTLLYNHTVKLYANATVLMNYTDNAGATNASMRLQNNIAYYRNQSLTIINIVTDYDCSNMSLCSFRK